MHKRTARRYPFLEALMGPTNVPPFATRSMTMTRLPPFPPILRWSLFLARFLPSIAVSGLAVALAVTPELSRVQAWIERVYHLSPDGYALMTALFGLFSIVWAGFPGVLKRVPVLHFMGGVIFTFPLAWYLASVGWFSLFVEPATPKHGFWLYLVGYVTLLVLFAIDAGLRLWFMTLDHDARKRESERTRWMD